MSTLHMILIAGMASWIISLPVVALFRSLTGVTRQREIEIDDETIMRRLGVTNGPAATAEEMEWL